jgi:hypothetical protein
MPHWRHPRSADRSTDTAAVRGPRSYRSTGCSRSGTYGRCSRSDTYGRCSCSDTYGRCSCSDTYGRCSSAGQACGPADFERQSGSQPSGNSGRCERILNRSRG